MRLLELDMEYRQCKIKGDNLRALKNEKSSEIGQFNATRKKR